LFLTSPLEIVLTVNAIRGQSLPYNTPFTPVRHKRHMQCLTSAPNFRGSAHSADPLTRPSWWAPAITLSLHKFCILC